MAKYSRECVEQKLEKYGYRILVYNEVKCHSKHSKLIDKDGYKYDVSLETFMLKDNPKMFPIVHNNNAYTIENIHTYIKNNNLDVELLSTEYTKNDQNLLFKCRCGNTFERTWANFQRRSAYICAECSSKLKYGSRDYEKILEIIDNIDLKPIIPINPVQPMTDYIDMIDSEGFLYYIKLNYLYVLGRKEVNVKRISKDNPYSIYNINLYLQRSFPEFTCISKTCNNHFSDVQIMHKTCGTIRTVTWEYLKLMLKHFEGLTSNEFCTHCRKRKLESYHASVLKQVFIHEYPDTILEDKTCINPKTGRSLPTDIVNHTLKIAIEIQSQFHDIESRKEIDEYKRKFWINRGYKFYDPDIRDYNIMELIQLFFPTINSIPSYVNYKFSNAIDYVTVQRYLSDSYTIEEIASLLNVKLNTIKNALKDNKLSSPSRRKGYNQITPIVRLDFDGNKIEEFPSIQEANRQGFRRHMLYRALYNEILQAYDSYWVTKEDYDNNNYFIPNYNCSIDKTDKNGNIIRTYNNIHQAELDSKLTLSEIKKALYFSKCKSCKGEYWRVHK